MNTPINCPCGSASAYVQCCGLFHSGASIPLTAEALMRSRFSAFYLHNEAYLLATWNSAQRPASIDFSDEKTQWLKLEIIAIKKGGIKDHKGSITFNAHYLLDNEIRVMNETSRFQKSDNRWFYITGNVKFYPAIEQPMMQNRNALCLCGSGKKFKHCCVLPSSQKNESNQWQK